MPIHTSWKSMAKGMSNYCKKGEGRKCRDFTDGTSVCLCNKAWSVFFATIRKHGWKETGPRGETVTETAFLQAVEETKSDFIKWWFNKQKSGVYPYTQVGPNKPIGGVGGGKKKKKRKGTDGGLIKQSKTLTKGQKDVRYRHRKGRMRIFGMAETEDDEEFEKAVIQWYETKYSPKKKKDECDCCDE